MKLKIASLAVVCSLGFSPVALAHPDGHDDEKPLPTTCAQLADTARYSNDETYPAVRALRIQCDAQRKQAAPKPRDKTE